jgi:methionyl-tRNA formyltransferase
VVVAFGQLIRPNVLAVVPMVNSHFSLLPRWRGAAPVERALLAGDAQTGVCLMQLEEGLDTGPVYDTVRVPIDADMTAATLRTVLVAAGVEQLRRCLGAPLPAPQAQIGEPTYAAKITPDTLRIDWASSSDVIDRQVRVGGAWTTFRHKRVKVWAVERVGHGDSLVSPVPGLTVTRVQPEGKAAMTADDFVRGARPRPGERFE